MNARGVAAAVLLAAVLAAGELPIAVGAGESGTHAIWQSIYFNVNSTAAVTVELVVSADGDVGNVRGIVFAKNDASPSITRIAGFVHSVPNRASVQLVAASTTLDIAILPSDSDRTLMMRQEWSNLDPGGWSFVALLGADGVDSNPAIKLEPSLPDISVKTAGGPAEYWLAESGERAGAKIHHRVGSEAVELMGKLSFASEGLAFYSIDSFGGCVCKLDGPPGEASDPSVLDAVLGYEKIVAGGPPGKRALEFAAVASHDADATRLKGPDYGTASYPLQWIAADVPPEAIGRAPSS